MESRAVHIFGLKIGEKLEPVKEIPPAERPFETPVPMDGTVVVENIGGIYAGRYINESSQAVDETRYIQQYRNMSMYPECDNAISEIVDAAVVTDETGKCVELNLDNVELSEKVKFRLQQSFENILKMLEFYHAGTDLFRRWYVDGKIAFSIMVDNDQPKAGITKLIPLDPMKITKKKEYERSPTELPNGKVVSLVSKEIEYFEYRNTEVQSTWITTQEGLKIHPDSIAYVHSGLIDYNTRRVVGYLHKAIRPLNMLRQTEDALLVYRIARAPERRVYYIDTGRLPPTQANQYIGSTMNQFRNRVEYNSQTGEIRSQRAQLSVLEDIFVPRMEGTMGTKIDTLPAGQAMDKIEDVLLFQKKLYNALNVPSGRLQAEGSGFNMGRSVEISREEVKFYKFVQKLRRQFSRIFMDMLRVDAILKGILTEEDWDIIKSNISFRWNTDNHFYDLLQLEMLETQMRILPVVDQYKGVYFSPQYIQKQILKMSDEEIEQIRRENIDFQKITQREIRKTETATSEEATENQGTEE